MYNWLKQKYKTEVREELDYKLDFGEITEEEADNIFRKKMEEWNDGYGDYMYDIKRNR